MKHTYLQHREERRALSGDMCGRFDNQRYPQRTHRCTVTQVPLVVCDAFMISRYMNTRPCYGEAYIPTDAEHRANIYTHAVRTVRTAHL